MAKEILEKDFEEVVLKSDKVTIVDFFATWCMPCQMMGQAIEEVAGDLPSNVQIVKVDVDKNPELSKKYGVMSIPTIVVIKNGEQVEKSVGFKPANELLDLAKSYK